MGVAEALSRYGDPKIFNTDQGSQFASEAFTRALKEANVNICMEGKGRWRDNVFVDRLSHSVKYEEIYLKSYATVAEAQADIGTYLDFYNSDTGTRK